GGVATLDYSIEPIGMGGALDGDRMDAGRDVNGDGIPDIYAGDILGDTASVFSGKDGSPLLALAGGDTFGSGGLVAALTGDGRADVLVGARLDDSGAHDAGKLSLFSGQDGSLVRSMTSKVASTVFGADATVLGDLNADGSVEFVVGASGSATGGKGK